MRFRYKQWILSAMVGFAPAVLLAQQGVTATGGFVSATGGSVSYSVGQVDYITSTGTSGSASQGVQQPFEISVVTGTVEAKDIRLTATVYPNPTSDYLTLEVKNVEPSALHVQLYDLNGKLVQSQKISGHQTQIAMGQLVPAIYFIKVFSGNTSLKEFKIIKK